MLIISRISLEKSQINSILINYNKPNNNNNNSSSSNIILVIMESKSKSLASQGVVISIFLNNLQNKNL